MPPIFGSGGMQGVIVGALPIQHAVAISPMRVRVTFPQAPRKQGGTGSGDAQDPARWTIALEGTPPAGDPGWKVVRVIEESVPNVLTVVLVLLRPLVVPKGSTITVGAFPLPFEFRVTGTGLKTASGVSFLPIAQVAGLFSVSPAGPTVDPAQPTFGSDLANPLGVSGLQLGADGDLAEHGGTDLLRKLILRRILTPRGAIQHLPNYGALPQTKGLVRPADLTDIQAQLRRDVLNFPDVLEAEVTAVQTEGTVQITVRARTKSGAEADVTAPLGVGA